MVSNTTKPRFFNTIKIQKNTLLKTSTDISKFIDEINWMVLTSKEFGNFVPKIIDYSNDKNKPFIKFEKINYNDLSYFFSKQKKIDYASFFIKLNELLGIFSNYKETAVNTTDIYTMYVTKTLSRLEELTNNEKISFYFNNKIIINNIPFKSLNELIEDIKKINIDEFNVNKFCFIHGDLCFSNIFFYDNNIKLIDPRGSFGSHKFVGDQNYEYAKIFHCIFGLYDYIKNDLIKINIKKENISISTKQIKFDYINDVIKSFSNVFKFSEKHLNIIKKIESLLFLSMVPLHKESFEHQMLMLSQGLSLFYNNKHLYEI